MTSNVVLTEAYSQWAAACEVQRRYMQHCTPALENVSYSAECRQLGDVGGDCYDFIQLPNGRLAMAVADASGKGLAAALMIASLQSSMRTAVALTAGDPKAVLTVVNRQACSSSLTGRYATLFYGVFDSRTRTLRYVNAGHNPPMVIRRDGSVQWLEAGGVPAGMFSDHSYAEGCIQLRRGDMVVAYTDGVVEALNSAGEEWGVQGLQNSAAESQRRCAEEVVNAIFDSLDEYSHGCQSDDATVTVLCIL